MVRRSSATSGGTTYWFLFLFFLLFCIPNISFAHAQLFRTEIFAKIAKANYDKDGDELDPGSTRLSIWRRLKAENTIGKRLSSLFQTRRRNMRG